MLAYAIGAENYEKLVACYSQKPAKMVEGSEAAVKSLQELVQKLRDAQTGIGSTRIMVDGKEYQSLVFNGIRFGIRTEALATGVYARCMNPSSIYDDSIIALRDEEKPTIVNNMAVYSARTTQTLATEYRNVPTAIGAVAAAPLKFKDNPPAPPGNPPKENQPQPHAGPGGQVGGGGGKEGGNVIANPRTINGIGTGGGGGTAGGSGGTSTGNSSDNGSGRGGELS